MTITITRNVQQQEQVEVQFPAYYQYDGSYYLIASEEKAICVTALTSYASILIDNFYGNKLSQVLSGEKITREEYGTAFKKAANMIWNVMPEDSEAIDNLLKEPL